MYQLGHRSRRNRLIKLGLAALIIIAVLAIWTGKNYFKTTPTIIKNAQPSTTVVRDNSTLTKSFSEGVFTLSLPQDWKYNCQDPTTIYHSYVFQNSDGTRQLRVYVDNLPTTLAVNRLMPVQAEGNRLTPGNVSDNCTSFTGSTSPNGAAAAKWSGVNFICDTGNYERDVVGTSSPQAVNSVSLNGPTKGTHNLFFTYTDNTAEPNYQIFVSTLNTFKIN